MEHINEARPDRRLDRWEIRKFALSCARSSGNSQIKMIITEIQRSPQDEYETTNVKDK